MNEKVSSCTEHTMEKNVLINDTLINNRPAICTALIWLIQSETLGIKKYCGKRTAIYNSVIRTTDADAESNPKPRKVEID